VPGERRGRLIHDEQLRLVRQCAGDLDHLAARDRELADLRPRVEIERKAREQCPRPAVQLTVTDDPERVDGLTSDPDVLRDAHGRHQVQFLMDHGDAMLERLARRAQLQRAAREQQLTGIRGDDPRDDVHERRLARAVFADQPVHRTPGDAQGNIIERHHTWKALARVSDLQQAAIGGIRGDAVHGALSAGPGNSPDSPASRARRGPTRSLGPSRPGAA